MNVKEEIFCRLCLKVADNDFEIIHEITREMFEVLLLRLNLDINKDPVMCKDCAEIAEKCFNFKSTCIDTEELILSFAVDKTKGTFKMKDVIKDVKGMETVDICRFCSNHSSGSQFVSLDTLMDDITFAEKLQKLMPEMDFSIIENPVICTSCIHNLEYYNKFIENSLDIEEKINRHFQNEGVPLSAQVKLSEILRFLYKNTMELDCTQMRAIKQEKYVLENISNALSAGYDSQLIKEEVLDIKDEVNFIEFTCENQSDMPVYKLNIPCGSKIQVENISRKESVRYNCAICIFQTKYKRNLKYHMIIHKNITEVKMYKCSKCTYETKHKNNLKSHKLIHKDITEVEMYKCSMCSLETKHKNSLKTHMLIHKDIAEIEMYKCSMCTYETKYKGHLKSHMLIHKDNMDMKMYKCSVCTYETKYKSHLKRHILIHKNIMDVEMYKCSMCTFETKHKGSLKTHMLFHKDITEVEMYKCSLCTFQTRHRGGVKKHMSTHKDITEMEMYKCFMCTYETKYKGHLKRHMLIHKGITEVKTVAH